jgi:hypothetical protein
MARHPNELVLDCRSGVHAETFPNCACWRRIGFANRYNIPEFHQIGLSHAKTFAILKVALQAHELAGAAGIVISPRALALEGRKLNSASTAEVGTY